MSSAEAPPRTVDEQLVQTITRWSLGIAMLVALFDLAILWNYPFPISTPVVRGVVYSVAGSAIVLGASACAFLGYRLVTMRVVGRSWRVYAIFLPSMAVIGSVVWLYLLSPA